MKVMDKKKLKYVAPAINILKIDHECSMAALSVVITDDTTPDDAGAKGNFAASPNLWDEESDGGEQ